MIAKLLKNNWPYIVIIGFGIVIYFMMVTIKSIHTENKRLTDNLQQILLERDSKVLEITKKEFKEYYAQQDTLLRELMDSIKLNYQHIERTINHKYTHVYDTTITLIVNKEDTTYKNFKHRFDDCVEVIGKVNWSENKIVFDELKVNYKATTVYYWKRKHRFWFVRWGRKQHYAITKNNCTGISTVMDINFKK